MTHTIYASICGHPIRTSSNLPWSGTTMDFDVRYCSPLCAQGIQTRNEHRTAESAYTSSRSRYERGSISRPEHRESRRRYDRSRAALEQYNTDWDSIQEMARESRGERTLRERGRSYAGLDDPEYLALRRDVRPQYDMRARFQESASHRRESEYRPQTSYRRPSHRYEPGRHADRSGSGFYDTSGMTRREEPPMRRESHAHGSSSSRRPSSRSDAYLDSLSLEELDQRRRDLERQLSRFR